jgi:hypothetical protein
LQRANSNLKGNRSMKISCWVRPLPNTAHQGCQDLAATAKGIDAPSLILIAVICGAYLLISLWAAFSGSDLSAVWL